ncbi:MAG TPA: hypothetical protein VNV66_06625, partial [Pilimelia sp.]|nr:hypothetical protein [Pilimelia sp.]
SSGPSPGPAPAGAHPVTIDATALAYHGFIIPGVTPAFIDSRRRQLLQLTPGRYGFQFASGYYASFTFTVTEAGTVDYAAEHESFLSGRGTHTLALDGLTVTIDARQVSGAGVLLANMPMTTADWIDRRQLRLLPARHYTVQQSSGELANLSFALGADGRFSYDPSLDVDAGGVLSGRGSPTLQFIGHRVCLDARSAGGSGVSVHPVWGMPFSRTGLQYVALLPQRRLALRLEPGSDSPLRFAVAANGTISHDPSLAPYLHTSRVGGHQVLTATGRPG